MRATIQLPDAVYDTYTSAAEGMAGLGKALSPEEIMVDRLTRFQGVSAQDRVIVVEPRVRARLEVILSGGSLMDGDDLLAKVEKLTQVSIGEIKIDWTPSEQAQLARWASRNRKTVEQVAKEIVDQIKVNFFERVP